MVTVVQEQKGERNRHCDTVLPYFSISSRTSISSCIDGVAGVCGGEVSIKQLYAVHCIHSSQSSKICS